MYHHITYICYWILGHEGIGSIRSYLSKKGWINAIQAYISHDISDLQMFDISIDLTEKGFEHRYDVISVIFAYIDLLKKLPSGIPTYILDELQILSKIAFDYGEKIDPASYVSNLVSNMQDYKQPMSYITGPRTFETPNPIQISNYLNKLIPGSTRIIISSPDFKGKTNQIGRYYNTEYTNKTLIEETLQWNKVKHQDYPDLSIPRPNLLIPNDFNLISNSNKLDSSSNEAQKLQLLQAPPVLIRNDNNWEVWYKLDESFKQPKIYSIISLAVSSELYNPLFIMNTKLFCRCFLDSITEYLYEAGLAGLNFNIDVNSKGVELYFSGFNDKISLFITEICQLLNDYKPSQDSYNRMKVLLQRELLNWNTEQPYYHASFYANLASETLAYPILELEKELNHTNIIQLNNFLSNILLESYGKALIIGNINQNNTNQLINIIENTFPYKSLNKNKRNNKRIALVPKSTQEVYGTYYNKNII